MNLLYALIIISVILTIISMTMGIWLMGEGGPVDRRFSNTLMRARVGLQGFTVFLLLIAFFLR